MIDIEQPSTTKLGRQKSIVFLLAVAALSFCLLLMNTEQWIRTILGYNTDNALGYDTDTTATKYQPNKANSGDNLVWVIGNGRTGTNFLGEILLSHDQIGGKNERQPEFNMIKDFVVSKPLLTPDEQQGKLDQIIRQYQRRSNEIDLDSSLLYHSDKSHPALFIADELHKAFPMARMVGINRCVFPTVASCMRHGGVSAWFSIPKFREKPNPFLGVTHDNIDLFSNYSLPVQCAMRWATHQLAYERMLPILNKDEKKNLLMFNYRDVLLDIGGSLQTLQHFLDLGVPFDNTPKEHVFDPLSYKTKIRKQDEVQIYTEFQRFGYSPLIHKYCHPSELDRTN